MTSAVVRLSINGDKKKLRIPVIQKIVRKVKTRATSHERNALNTLRSVMAFTYVIAVNKNKNSCANSTRKCSTARSTTCDDSPSAYWNARRAQISPAANTTGFDFLRRVYSSA